MKQSFYILFFAIFLNCKNHQNNDDMSFKMEKQENEITLIGISRTSGMTDPSNIRIKVKMIILKDSIFKIKTVNGNRNQADTILRKKNNFKNLNVFDMIPQKQLRNQVIGSFGRNDDGDWLIAIERKNKEHLTWQVADLNSETPDDLKMFVNTIESVWYNN